MCLASTHHKFVLSQIFILSFSFILFLTEILQPQKFILFMNSSSEFAAYSDAELIKLVSECQLHAFEALYERHAEAVYSLVIKITREASIADVVLQEIFWQIWCEPNSLHQEKNLMAYFCRVARCASLQQLRLRNKHNQLSL